MFIASIMVPFHPGLTEIPAPDGSQEVVVHTHECSFLSSPVHIAWWAHMHRFLSHYEQHVTNVGMTVCLCVRYRIPVEKIRSIFHFSSASPLRSLMVAPKGIILQL